MNLKQFSMICLVLVVLISVSHALPPHNINDVEITLISNTDECLVDCEAWIGFDTSNRIAPIQVPPSSNANFKFNFMKRSSKTFDLIDWGIEVWQEQDVKVLEYCRDFEEKTVEKDFFWNGECDLGYCSELNETQCSCKYGTRTVCGSHFESEWVRVAESWWGFKFQPNEFYRLRVWGKKQPKLGENDIDWIPSFMGERIPEWAWWNNDWLYSRKITVTANVDLNAGWPVDLNATDFNLTQLAIDGKACGNLTDIRMVYDGAEVGSADENGYWLDSNRFWFSLPVDIASGNSIDFNIYYGNNNCPGRTVAPDFNAPATDFNGETSSATIYNFHFEESTGPFLSSGIFTDYNFSGIIDPPTKDANLSYLTSLRFNGTSESLTYNGDAHDWNFPSGSIEVSFNPVQTTGWKTLFGFVNDVGNEFFWAGIGATNGEIFVKESVGGVSQWKFTVTLDPSNMYGKWHHLLCDWNTGGGLCYMDGKAMPMTEGASTNFTGISAEFVKSDFGLGARQRNSSIDEYFKGNIDEFRVTNIQKNNGYKTYDFSNGLQMNDTITVGDEETILGVTADITYFAEQVVSENKVVVHVDANNTSSYSDVTPSTFEWFFDNNQTAYATDVNILDLELPYAGDWNLTLRVTGTSGATTFVDDENLTISLNSGRIGIHFRDENTYATLNPNLTINGDTNTTTNGYIQIDLNNTTNADYTLLASDVDKSERTWFWADLNQFAQIDVNATLLDSDLGKEIDFQFWNEEQAEVFANGFVEAWWKGVEDGNMASRIQLDNTGKGSMFLNNAIDTNYLFEIISSDANTHYYETIKLNIQVPKDEETLTEVTPYNAKITNLTTFNFLAQSSFIQINMFGNTDSFYIVDTNATGYYNRTNYLKILGDTPDYNFQPYLISTTTGIQSELYVRKTRDGAGLPNVRIVSKKSLTGLGLTTVEEKYTDVAGSASLSFVEGDTYYLDFYYQNELVWENAELRPIDTKYQFYLDLQDYTFYDFNATVFDVNFYPSDSYIDSNFMVDLNVETSVENATIDNINILVYFDTNTLYDFNTSSTGFVNIPNLGIANAPPFPLTVRITLTTTRGDVLVKVKTYTVRLSRQQQTVLTFLTKTIPDEFNLGRHSHNKEVTTLLAVLITIFAVGAISSKARVDFVGSTVFGMICLGFFFVLGWMLFEVFIASCLVATAFILLTRGFY